MSSDDIEIIDVEDNPSIPNENTALYKILTETSSDEEIVCLDTIFKPSNSNETDIKSKVEEKEVGPSISSTSNVNNDSSTSTTQPTGPTNFFDTDEDSIDELLNPPSLSTSFEFSGFPTKTASQDTNEPPTKKLKPQNFKSTITTTNANTPNKVSKNRYNPLDCTYRLPEAPLLHLIVLFLKSANCLTVNELWDYISGMFPYFEYHFDPEQGVRKLTRILSRCPQFFLKTSSKVLKNQMITKKLMKNRKLIMLNPITIHEQSTISETVGVKKESFNFSLYDPQIFDSLLTGTLDLKLLKLFHDRKPYVEYLQNTGENPSTSDGHTEYAAAVAERQSSSAFEQNLKDVNVLELVDEGERDSALSPRSNSSSDTVVFDPKIMNCRTLNTDECDTDFLAANEYELSSNGLDAGLQGSFMKEFESMPFIGQGIGSEAFANTVWSNEISIVAESVALDKAMDEKEGRDAPSFPEVDKCIPRWKEIFPWMQWKPWLKKIYCRICQEIHNKINSKVIIEVIEIVHPDDVFKVSKLLRTHAEKRSHKMAFILKNKNIISTLFFLLNSHFSEFNSLKEILNTFGDLFPNGSVNQDLLTCTIQMLGEYLEDKIIADLKKSKKFTIITDPCAGLLVVRYMNDIDEPEEHIVSSFSSVNNKTPSEYLSSLGVQTKNMLVYVTNSRCEDCQRCKLTKRVHYKNSTPLRLPQLDRYLVFLWRTKLLKPFYSVGTTICKLWLGFPHKFTDIGKLVSLEKLSKFPSNPDSFMDVFQHFGKIKEIAASIYLLTGNLEALGLQTIDISKYSWMLNIFPILTNINILLLEIKTVYPFVKDFDNLFHNVEKLKLFCDKTKEALKNKTIQHNDFDAADIDDVYHLVNMTVKEYQQPIYQKGRSVALAFNRMTTARNLEQYRTNTSLQHTFCVLYSAIKAHYRYENIMLLKSLQEFLKEHPSCERKSPIHILKYFHTNSESIKDNNIIYTFYKILAYFPFQPVSYERSLYETKINDYLYYRSAWTGVGPNIKDHLRTIIHELHGKHILSEKDMLTWWKSKVK